MTYWVVPNSPPRYVVDAWEALHAAFGTEPFSRRQGLAVLMEQYPSLASSNLERIFDGFVEDGSLGVDRGDF